MPNYHRYQKLQEVVYIEQKLSYCSVYLTTSNNKHMDWVA